MCCHKHIEDSKAMGRKFTAAIGWWRVWTVFLLATSMVQHAFPADEKVPREYQLKAAFLFNFTKFVEWPTQSFAIVESPVVIGVLGKNPFGNELENAVKARTINGRPLLVKFLTTIESAREVQLLFVAQDYDQQKELFIALKHTNVLTVGESESFAKQGGIITLTLEGDKLRFEINMDSADEAKLKISAQLQKLATAVRRQP